MARNFNTLRLHLQNSKASKRKVILLRGFITEIDEISGNTCVGWPEQFIFTIGDDGSEQDLWTR